MVGSCGRRRSTIRRTSECTALSTGAAECGEGTPFSWSEADNREGQHGPDCIDSQRSFPRENFHPPPPAGFLSLRSFLRTHGNGFRVVARNPRVSAPPPSSRPSRVEGPARPGRGGRVRGPDTVPLRGGARAPSPGARAHEGRYRARAVAGPDPREGVVDAGRAPSP